MNRLISIGAALLAVGAAAYIFISRKKDNNDTDEYDDFELEELDELDELDNEIVSSPNIVISDVTIGNFSHNSVIADNTERTEDELH